MYRYIDENKKLEIVRDFGSVTQKLKSLNKLMKKYDLVEYKYISNIWDLDYPVLDHPVMFRARNGKEYVASNSYIDFEELDDIAKNRPDLEFEWKGSEMSFYQPYLTKLIMISKR